MATTTMKNRRLSNRAVYWIIAAIALIALFFATTTNAGFISSTVYSVLDIEDLPESQ